MDNGFPIFEISENYIKPYTSNFSNRHLQTIILYSLPLKFHVFIAQGGGGTGCWC
jgi:hypothetical protein